MCRFFPPRQGFLVLERFAGPSEVASLRHRVDQIIQDFDPSTVTSIFSTRNQARYAGWGGGSCSPFCVLQRVSWTAMQAAGTLGTHACMHA